MVTNYTQTCPVLFGVGAIEQLGEKVLALGVKKVLCVYDAGVKVSGIADRVSTILKNSGLEVVVFDQVTFDAPNTVIDEGGKLAKKNNVAAVIGIGGGSSLDTAKAIRVLVENPLPISRYYAGKGNYFAVTIPLILVPTAAGTGSEVTAMSVVHDLAANTKEAVLNGGTLAIVDPELTLTVPPAVTAATGMDALSHAIEAYTSNTADPKSDLLAIKAIELIAKNIITAYKEGQDIEARTNMMLASNFAGIAFNDASVHFGHAAAHAFGTTFHMPHGVGCALATPEVIEFSAEVIPERTIEIAKALGCDLPAAITGVTAGQLAADKVREIMHEIGISAFSELGITKEAAMNCAEDAMKNWFTICAQKEVTTEVMAELIGKMYDNYPQDSSRS
jgi:alcohol dehydrogenase class IV